MRFKKNFALRKCEVNEDSKVLKRENVESILHGMEKRWTPSQSFISD